MARKEIKTYQITDDLTGESLNEDEAVTLAFSYGGTSYEIDLSKKNADKLDTFIAPYIDAARKVRAPKASPSKKSGIEGRPGLRAWAKENGFKVSDRGRVSQEAQDAYDAAH